MQKRSTGQMGLADGLVTERASFLDEVSELIDWAPVQAALSGIYASKTGRPSYPLLAMFKALLLQQWYGLSDPGLEEALYDRLSFRRFCGLAMHDDVPDHSTLWRFREQLGDRAEDLLHLLNEQFEARGLMLKRGTLMDASFVKASSGKREVDPEAGRFGQNKEGSVSGYKAHIGADEGSGLVRRVAVTPANVNDTTVADELICGDEQAVYADKAYDKKARRARLESQGIFAGLMHRPSGTRKLTPAQTEFNKAVGKVRAPVERHFAVAKRYYGLRRTRYRGLARASTQIHLAFIAMNLKRALRLA